MLLLMVTMLLYPVLRFWMFVFTPGGTWQTYSLTLSLSLSRSLCLFCSVALLPPPGETIFMRLIFAPGGTVLDVFDDFCPRWYRF